MRKLVSKLKGKKGGQSSAKDDRPPPPHPDGGGSGYIANSKYTVVNPVPPPPIRWDGRRPPSRDARAGDDVGTFAGFGAWMASFEPDPQARGVVEVAAQPVDAPVYMTEVLSLEAEWPSGYMLRLVLSGVKKPGDSARFAVGINGPWFMTLQQVNDLLARHGYERMISAKHGRYAVGGWNPEKALPSNYEIPIVDGPSYYPLKAADGSGPLISKDERIGAFLDNLRRLRVRCKEDKVVVSSFPAELEVGFNRTLRLPEDNQVHYQPVRLGSIPVNNVAGIVGKLEASRNQSLMEMARKGGVFFPLYQREAMFLSFQSRLDAFAVRVFVGGVNAVSGRPWDAGSPPRQQGAATQDYLCVPPQEFLDGISVGQDVVRQFVAMPLGSGYSVEKQVTGKETVGGIQLEIVPGNRWVVQVPASPDLPQQGNYTPEYQDKPSKFGVNVLVLARNELPKQTGDPGGDTAAEDEAWLRENRPIYMRHLFQTQIAPPYNPYGQPSALAPFHAGLTVQMTAVYVFSLTLTYWYEREGMYRTEVVKWAPWWTLDQCFAERRAAEFKIDGKSIDELTLYGGNRLLGRYGTLQEQGVQDGDTVNVQTVSAAQGYQGGGPSYELGQGHVNASTYQQPAVFYPPPGPGYTYQGQGPASPPQPNHYAPVSLPYNPASSPQAQPPAYQIPSYRPPQQGYPSPPQSYPSPQGYSPPQMGYPSSHMPSSPPQSYGHMSVGDTTASSPPQSYSHMDAEETAATSPPTWNNSVSEAYSPAVSTATPPSLPTDYHRASTAQTSYTNQSSPPPAMHMAPHSSRYESAPQQTGPSSPPASVPSPRPKPQDSSQTGWAMGLAAGTRVRQAIRRDPFGHAGAWARGRATVLSAQILNSVAFEALTGLLAPPSPITPQAYLARGLPFLASWDEGVATEGSARLASVRTVGEVDALAGPVALAASVAGSPKVGCTCCGRMLCDSILRPCNHAFCSGCIASTMTHGPAVFCRICNGRATRLVGFSAPMALPGEDRVDLSGARVVATTKPGQGGHVFQSVYEMDAAWAPVGAGSPYEMLG